MTLAEGNVYQRKAAVSAALDGIVADGKNEHLKNEYISIRGLTNALRPATVAAGLDIASEVIIDPSGQRAAIITLTNVDKPEEKIVQQFACETPKDQGGSYIVKYALMKLFLVADDTDPDATLGKAQTTASQPESPSNGKQSKARPRIHTSDLEMPCPLCGKELQRKQGEKDGKPFDFIGCAGYPRCKFTDNDVPAYLEPQPVGAVIDGDVNPNDVPF